VHPAAVKMEKRHGRVVLQWPGGKPPLLFVKNVLRHWMQIRKRL
jgi:hypothetical protein